jgi:hypothetical protein
MSFEEYENHQHETNKLAMEILKIISLTIGETHKFVIDKFKNGDYLLTDVFWQMIKKEENGKYNRVEFCNCCRKFTLYHEDEA